MRVWARRLAFILVALRAALPVQAGAGAWTLAEGDGLFIVTSGRTTAPADAMLGGLAEEDSSSLRVYAEYGVMDGLTLGLTASAEWDALTLETDLRLGGHARLRVWQGGKGDVVSVQIGGSWPVEGWFGDPLLAGGSADSVPEVQVGLNYGRGWISDWGDTFATGEVAFRWRGGREADELRFEGTAGHSVSRRLMGLFGLYAAVPLGSGDASLKLAPSVAWTMWPRLGSNDKKPAEFAHPRTIQLGVSYDVLNPDDGMSMLIGVWNRF